jgi:DNA-binding NtrC family response regulator
MRSEAIDLRTATPPPDNVRQAWLSRLLDEYGALVARHAALNDTTRSLLALLAGPEPPLPPQPEPGTRLVPALRDYERSLVEWALARSKGQQLAAARLLGVSPSTLNEKMKRLRIPRPVAPA